ncbi:polysaccharide pyruvyl transferase family protein [Rhizosphaericola mali]|uniref:Polysaccharide pyruvyl transferase family protein n=1 Tax=Rhizosphaericola mali TaxID=2545455 RepID=A0A5P2G5G3_9BACT|nr:polysaccharide pyruvyl transferase family protein [Rhizosphaericola mali]
MFPLDKESKDVISPVIKKFDFATARDQASAEALSIELGYDDAFLGISDEISRYSKSLRRNIPDVMICIQSDLSKQECIDKTISLVREKIIKFNEQGMVVGYVEALPHSDHYAYEKLSDLINKENWFSAKECIRYGLPVKKGQLWYSTRFHHHLVAASAGAKGVAISYKPGYYDIKHKSLLNLGTGWNYFTPYSSDTEIGLPMVNLNFEDIAKKISKSKQAEAFEIYNFQKTTVNNSSQLNTAVSI